MKLRVGYHIHFAGNFDNKDGGLHVGCRWLRTAGTLVTSTTGCWKSFKSSKPLRFDLQKCQRLS